MEKHDSKYESLCTGDYSSDLVLQLAIIFTLEPYNYNILMCKLVLYSSS